jgi:hypothetical protein
MKLYEQRFTSPRYAGSVAQPVSLSRSRKYCMRLKESIPSLVLQSRLFKLIYRFVAWLGRWVDRW